MRRAARVRSTVPALLLALACLLAMAWGGARAEEAGYRVGPGDVLEVSIFGYENLSGERRVREDGRIALHLLGRIAVAGRTLAEIEGEIAARARDTFQSEPSVLVAMAAYRDVFVTGEVDAPGAYPFRPDLTVIKAMALAGGLRRGTTGGEAGAQQRALEAQRRAAQAGTRIAAADARIAAIDAELARLEAGGSAVVPGEEGSAEDRLMSMRRALLARSIEQSERQSVLAEEEAESMRQRRLLIENQRAATDEQLARTEELMQRGLTRQGQLLDLQIAADEYRADELESAAFEARARQVAANAESQIEIDRTRYRQDLLAARIEAEQDRALSRAEFEASRRYLATVAGASTVLALGGDAAPIYVILRGTGAAMERIEAGPATPLRPDDVLEVVVPVEAPEGQGNE